MNELSLFTGCGGGLLASHLLGWKTIGAVEIEPYPCAVLAQRQRDGFLEDFPIWCMDIREFNARIAPMYRGMVDVVTAGFPCQPFSLAGRRRGSDDERNMWPATIESIRLVRPRFALLENVPGILTWNNGDYFRTILGNLSEAGYNAEWMVLGANDCGAPHRRKRLWILAYPRRFGRNRIQPERQSWSEEAAIIRIGREVSDTAGLGRREGRAESDRTWSASAGVLGSWWSSDPADAERGDDGEERATAQRDRDQWGRWSTEPILGRVAHVLADRLDFYRGDQP